MGLHCFKGSVLVLLEELNPREKYINLICTTFHFPWVTTQDSLLIIYKRGKKHYWEILGRHYLNKQSK